MLDWIDVGSSPTEESCAQVGTQDYHACARRECRAYINQLRRVVGQEPAGTELRIRSHSHDFGSYLSVACYYDPAVAGAIDYALRCEGQGPTEWDEEAKRELTETKGGA
jgi:hypothetical protein